MHPFRSAQRTDELRLVWDLPPESPPVAALPLGLAYDTSRIPLNHYNASFAQLTADRTMEIAQSDFAEVFVVHAFQIDDRLRRMLERAIVALSCNAGPSALRFVDIATPAEFIRAVNDFDGATDGVDPTPCQRLYRSMARSFPSYREARSILIMRPCPQQ